MLDQVRFFLTWAQFGVHQTQVWKYLANVAWGVTTVRDPQTATTDVLTYADQIETGELIGPRLYHTGPGVFWNENFQSLDDARNTLKRYSEFYHTHWIKQYMVGNRKQRQWVIMAARELGLMPTTEGGLDFKMNLTEMLDGYPGHEHSYPLMPLYQDAVQLTAQSGITYTPTLLVNYGGPFGEDYFFEHYNGHDDPKMRRFVPHEVLDERFQRRDWFRDDQYVYSRIAASAAAGRGQRRYGVPRRDGRHRLSLGAVGDERGRDVPTRGDSRRHDRRGARPGARQGSGFARARQVRRSHRAGRRSATRHSQHQHDPLRDEERPALRWPDAQRGLAAAEEPADDVVVGD
jgi:hypothetical protein